MWPYPLFLGTSPRGGMETGFEDPDGNSFQELEIAKQVQARLFPQMLPPLPSLDYAGICIQARQVGFALFFSCIRSSLFGLF
jgi:serine phosphatase RsbU (regulator of sigma subunit)